MFWKITPFTYDMRKINEFKRFHPNPNDGIINYLELTNILDAETAAIARILIRRTQLNSYKIQNLCNFIIPRCMHEFREIPMSTITNLTTNDIPQKKYILGVMIKNNSTYMFSIMNSNNNLYLIDPQVNGTSPIANTFDYFNNHSKIFLLYFMFRSEIEEEIKQTKEKEQKKQREDAKRRDIQRLLEKKEKTKRLRERERSNEKNSRSSKKQKK
jgi:hypothetical protein